MRKESKFSWKATLITAVLTCSFLYFDVGSFVFNQDQGLWDQAGWKSYEDEHIKRVKLLLWLGADPAYANPDDSRQLPVLQNAVEWGNLEIIDILLPLLPRESHARAMAYACSRGPGMKSVIEFLNDKGITPSRPVESEELIAVMPEVCL